MTLYKKKYRIETNRLQNHAYGEGKYFVTICTRKKMQWFGEIQERHMQLSELGKITEKFINEIPTHFPQTKIGAYAVMPDHIHIIINIATRQAHVETRDSRVSTKKFLLPPNTLGSILNQLKGTITKWAKLSGYGEFRWQPRYHDRIIRSAKELGLIKKYITRNPDRWDKESIPWHADGTSWSL